MIKSSKTRLNLLPNCVAKTRGFLILRLSQKGIGIKTIMAKSE